MSTAVADPKTVDDLFDMVFDASGVSTEDLEKKGGGGQVSKDGFYHLIVNGIEVESGGTKVPCVRIDCGVLAGTEEDQIGRAVFHRIYLKKRGDGGLVDLDTKAQTNIMKFFINIGLLTKDEVAGNAKVAVPWSKLETHQFIAEVKNDPYDEKDKTTQQPTGKKIDSFKIPYGLNVWEVSDERMNHVPKDPDALADFTGGAGIGDVDDI